MKKIYYLYCIAIILLTACNSVPSNVAENLKKSGENKSEIEKVLEHYKDDEQKLKAAYFLIGNMDEREALIGDFFDYNGIYTYIDSVKATLSTKELYNAADEKLKELEQHYGPIQNHRSTVLPDLENITAEYLIKNIDQSFEVWKNNPWCKGINFETFCNFILPYRVHNEPLSDFREFFIEELSWLKDSMKNTEDLEEACLLVNNFLAARFTFVENIGRIPYPTAIDMYKNAAGECEQRYFLIVSAMRSIGIPVSIDFSFQWNHWPGHHSWVALVNNGETLPFNAGEPYTELPQNKEIPIGLKMSSTVFRHTFSRQDYLPMAYESSQYLVPENFRNTRLVDVTDHYNYAMTDLKIEFTEEQREQTIYLGCYGYGKEIVTVDYLAPEDTSFGQMGQCGIYIPYHFKNNKMEFLSYPFILSCETDEKWYSNPLMDKMDTAVLTRKFDLQDSMIVFSANMVGAKFIASNSKDFVNADTIYSIEKSPRYFVTIPVNTDKKYRYVKYEPLHNKRINMAEIQFLNQSDTIEGKVFGDNLTTEHLLFDNNIRTNHNAPSGSSVAVDFGSPKQLTNIRFLARNNFNIVEPGDIYELFYFDYEWKSLGIQKAISNELVYQVPRYSLLLLRDLSKGKEERIFKYENGEQIFW